MFLRILWFEVPKSGSYFLLVFLAINRSEIDYIAFRRRLYEVNNADAYELVDSVLCIFV